jgi:hypothetical protein
VEPVIDPELIDGRPFALTPWLKPLSVYGREETHEGGCMRYG